MRKKMTKILALCVFTAVVVSGCGGASAGTSSAASGGSNTQAETEPEEPDELAIQAEEGLDTAIDCEPIEISLGCSGTVDGTVMGDAIYAGIEAVAKWTNGNFVVNFYPGGQLGGDMEMIEGAQIGSIDMFTGAPTSQVSLIEELAVLDIGGLYEDLDAANTVLDQFKDQFEEYYSRSGLHLVNIYAPSFRILTSNKPIVTGADLKGLNIRTQENKYHMAFWSALGTNPTPLAFGELYIALQQGMLDAEENPWASIVGAKLCEVQKYAIETNHIPFASTYVMNKSKYDNMSEAQKKACDQFVEFVKRYQLAGTAADDARLAKLCEDDFGVEVTPVSDEIKAMYVGASQVVIDMMKEELDPAFVDSYVEAARAAAAQ